MGNRRHQRTKMAALLVGTFVPQNHGWTQMAPRGRCLNRYIFRNSRISPLLSRPYSSDFLILWDKSNDEDESTDETHGDEERINPEVTRLKTELMALATRTNRGFQATKEERDTIRDVIYELARFNPSKNPARGYYDSNTILHGNDDAENDSCTISGKWTLIYTDAPDITGLDTSRNPFATAKLGRIGQECYPPYIRNVIEWLRPDWASNVPFSGTESSRIFQKVVTSASASPSKPLMVDLKVAGLEFISDNSGITSPSPPSLSSNNGIQDFVQRVQDQGLPSGLLSLRPIDWKSPLNPPFGQFEILYVDEDIRVIRTGQNYLAANQRIRSIEEEWF